MGGCDATAILVAYGEVAFVGALPMHHHSRLRLSPSNP